MPAGQMLQAKNELPSRITNKASYEPELHARRRRGVFVDARVLVDRVFAAQRTDDLAIDLPVEAVGLPVNRVVVVVGGTVARHVMFAALGCQDMHQQRASLTFQRAAHSRMTTPSQKKLDWPSAAPDSPGHSQSISSWTSLIVMKLCYAHQKPAANRADQDMETYDVITPAHLLTFTVIPKR